MNERIKRPKLLKREEPTSPYKIFWQVLLSVIALILFLVLIFEIWLSANCFVVEVVGSSMYDTVTDGDFVYAKRTSDGERGDVIVIDVTDYKERDNLTGDFIIKRLIALEGDTVYCDRNGVVYLKKAGEEEFSRLNEPYANGVTSSFEEVTVGEGEIFFLGDNRGVSKDSRMVGCYKQSDIVGVVPNWSIEYKSVLFGLGRARTGG